MEKILFYMEKVLLYVLAALVSCGGIVFVLSGPTVVHIIGGALLFAFGVLVPSLNEEG